jgi:hypothetical protein
MPLVATAVGAALALGGAVLGERMRSRVEHAHDLRAERLSSYHEFVVAVDAAFTRLRIIADPANDAASAEPAADRAIGESRVFEAREKLLMSASPAVVRAGELVLDRLGDLRRIIAGGARRQTMPYHDAYHAYSGALWRLRQIIRDDLGNADLSPADVGKRDWDSSDTCTFCQSAKAAA